MPNNRHLFPTLSISDARNVIITDRVSEERNAIGRVRPSVFVSTLSFEPTNLRTF